MMKIFKLNNFLFLFSLSILYSLFSTFIITLALLNCKSRIVLEPTAQNKSIVLSQLKLETNVDYDRFEEISSENEIISVYHNLLNIDPQNVRLQIRFALVLLQTKATKDIEISLGIISNLQKKMPDNPDVLFSVAFSSIFVFENSKFFNETFDNKYFNQITKDGAAALKKLSSQYPDYECPQKITMKEMEEKIAKYVGDAMPVPAKAEMHPSP